MNVLLVEADYKNKYPPLALMKISAYHKNVGDSVVFVKGKNKELKLKKWDRIYITTLFTFYWKKTIETIKYYYDSVSEHKKIYIGGAMATLLENELIKEEGLEDITIFSGLLDKPYMLGDEDKPIDLITPDYSIVDRENNIYLNYDYKVNNAYFTSTTKGCVRNCEFCAVSKLEPNYCNYINIKTQIREIDVLYGSKRDLMLMDNNILASNKLKNIVDDLIELGFYKGNRCYEKKSGKRTMHLTRRVDFNQGIDARLLTENKMKHLAKLEIRPLRIAFDHADEENVKIYVNAQRLAAKYGISHLSNYILFNFQDTPKDLYKRLKINICLNEEFAKKGLKTNIWSFPMKYMPFSGEHCKDRKYIGEHWNAKMLRGVQCILNATHAVVGPKKDFFNLAFGKNFEEFEEIIYMPELFITKRKENKEKIEMWKRIYKSLSIAEKREFILLIKDNVFLKKEIKNRKILKLYECYYK